MSWQKLQERGLWLEEDGLQRGEQGAMLRILALIFVIPVYKFVHT